MWHSLRISPETDPEFVSAVTELSQSTMRTLVYTTGGMCLFWFLVPITKLWWTDAPAGAFLILIVSLLTSGLALRLLARRFVTAQAVWLIGLAAVITLAIQVYAQPEIAFLYALLPFLAVATVGWPAGVLVEGLLIALMWWLSRNQLTLVPLAPYELGVIVGGVITGLLGWAAMHSTLTATQWSLSSYQQAHRIAEEALDQRVELKQTSDDLIQANNELARLSDRLKAMHQVAEEARRAKAEFVANVSHELRTPLNLIIGFSEMITQTPQVYATRLPAELLADIAAIQRNSRYLARLVDDVLDLSQVEAGRMALSKEWVSLESIIEEATLAVCALYESKALYLEKSVSPELPNVFCDATRIHQVLLNLMSNAGRFTERGGGADKRLARE